MFLSSKPAFFASAMLKVCEITLAPRRLAVQLAISPMPSPPSIISSCQTSSSKSPDPRHSASMASPQIDGRPLMTAIFCTLAMGGKPSSAPNWIAIITPLTFMPFGARPELMTMLAKRNRSSVLSSLTPRSPRLTGRRISFWNS